MKETFFQKVFLQPHFPHQTFRKEVGGEGTAKHPERLIPS
jgi:hypothetical protein